MTTPLPTAARALLKLKDLRLVAIATAHQLVQLLAVLTSEYRERNSQNKPGRIEISADVLALLQEHREADFKLEKSGGGYTFEGVPIVSKPGQSLPFILRP